MSFKHSPCHDPKTGYDCPKRCAGCASTCEEWATYASERDKVYTRRRINGDATYVLDNMEYARRRRVIQGKLNKRRTKHKQ